MTAVRQGARESSVLNQHIMFGWGTLSKHRAEGDTSPGRTNQTTETPAGAKYLPTPGNGKVWTKFLFFLPHGISASEKRNGRTLGVVD